MNWNPMKADFNKFPWSVPLGSILRIPVRLHVTFFILWLAQTLGSIYYGFWYVMLSLLVMGPMLLMTILVHELGHCLAARSIGGTVDSIMLWPLGGLAYMSYNTTYLKSIWVSAAGPLTHIPMVAIWVALLVPAYHASTGSWNVSIAFPPVDERHFGHAICLYGVVLNIALFVFNLLVPAYPLDGGRILAMLLLLVGVPMRTAAIVTVSIATAIGVGLFVFGIVVFQMVTILLAVFILFATFQLFRAIRNNQVEEHPLFASVSADSAAPAAGGGPGAGAMVGPAAGSATLDHPGSKSSGAMAGPPVGVSGPSGFAGYPGYPPAAASGPSAYPGYPAPGRSGPSGFQPQGPSNYYSGNAV